MPDRPDAAGGARATSVGVHRVGLAVDFEGLVLGGGHDVPDRDGRRLLGEEVAALGAAHAFDQSRAAKAQQDLLDVISGQPLDVGQLPRRDRADARPAPAGEMDRDDQAVFGPGSDPHEGEYGRRASRDSSWRPRASVTSLSAAVQRATSSALSVPVRRMRASRKTRPARRPGIGTRRAAFRSTPDRRRPARRVSARSRPSSSSMTQVGTWERAMGR